MTILTHLLTSPRLPPAAHAAALSCYGTDDTVAAAVASTADTAVAAPLLRHRRASIRSAAYANPAVTPDDLAAVIRDERAVSALTSIARRPHLPDAAVDALIDRAHDSGSAAFTLTVARNPAVAASDRFVSVAVAAAADTNTTFSYSDPFILMLASRTDLHAAIIDTYGPEWTATVIGTVCRPTRAQHDAAYHHIHETVEQRIHDGTGNAIPLALRKGYGQNGHRTKKQIEAFWALDDRVHAATGDTSHRPRTIRYPMVNNQHLAAAGDLLLWGRGTQTTHATSADAASTLPAHGATFDAILPLLSHIDAIHAAVTHAHGPVPLDAQADLVAAVRAALNCGDVDPAVAQETVCMLASRTGIDPSRIHPAVTDHDLLAFLANDTPGSLPMVAFGSQRRRRYLSAVLARRAVTATEASEVIAVADLLYGNVHEPDDAWIYILDHVIATLGDSQPAWELWWELCAPERAGTFAGTIDDTLTVITT